MTPQPQQEPTYLISERLLNHIITCSMRTEEMGCSGCPYAGNGVNCAVSSWEDAIRSRPAPSPEPKFNSTDLLLLAHDEWKRREERKHNHDMRDWEAGFINGFLTDKRWAREMVDKIRTGGEPR